MPWGSPFFRHVQEHEIQTRIGAVPVRRPRVHDRESGEAKFGLSSAILPRSLRRTKSIEELLPWRESINTLISVTAGVSIAAGLMFALGSL